MNRSIEPRNKPLVIILLPTVSPKCPSFRISANATEACQPEPHTRNPSKGPLSPPSILSIKEKASAPGVRDFTSPPNSLHEFRSSTVRGASLSAAHKSDAKRALCQHRAEHSFPSICPPPRGIPCHWDVNSALSFLVIVGIACLRHVLVHQPQPEAEIER